ncbi:Signal transduction histidine kinase [Atopomonas hussainii]|uniref:histidine kinase n=1 Tax=Atopomonas hussainii TaxID=1429083 RepID=A0A1H7LVV1_9GAMM|nr:Signal transduction histidine kinase [Atopomonas hussainii]
MGFLCKRGLVFVALLSLLLTLPAKALTFDEFLQSEPLGQHVEVLEDVRGEWTITDVASPQLLRSFRPLSQPVLNAGYSNSVFWLRLVLDYQPVTEQRDARWLLELAYPPLDSVKLYVTQEGQWREIASGDSLPFAARPIKAHTYLFPLPLAAGQSEVVYLRLQSEGSLQAPLTLWSPISYLEEQPGRIYALGMIYGVLLVMLVYNLFIFISVRDWSYLFYILYIGSFGLYQLSVNGAAIEYFWPDNPWWANAATPFLVGMAGVFGSQFARSFLHTSEHSPWLDRLLLALMLWAAGCMVLALTSSYSVAMPLATLMALVFSVLVFTAGLVALWRGMRVARYFLFAWTAFLLGGVINTLMVMGYLPNMFLTMYASQIGSAIEVALLSLALADRINALKEERARILHEASEKLQVLNKELANSNRLKDEFLSNLTHELRTPMNGVIGALELMQTVPMSTELQEYQRTATGSARDMLRMVDDILALTQLQASKLYALHEPFSLRSLLDGLRQDFAPKAQARGLTFTVQLDEKLPDIVESDAGKLAQALSYLLDNALKFTRKGHVRLQVSQASAEPGRSLTLRFEVSDTGIGFDEEFGQRIYDNFRQADGSHSRAYAGLGIGLSLCQQLVGLLRGELSHTSTPNVGSCFTLKLKLGLPHTGRPLHELPKRLPDETLTLHREPHECKVLLVEDDPVNQLVIRGMLLRLGYQVRTADNGEEALTIVGREAFDGVLMDCQMPYMDGFAACRALRELPSGKQLPVLAVTAYTQNADRERCLAAGMDDYLAKPVRLEELKLLLQRWVLARPHVGQ